MKENKQRCSFINIPLSSYNHIIEEYWDCFNRTLDEYNKDVMSTSGIDPRVIQLIKGLKSIDKWKSNLYILYLHYHKTKELAKVLNINQSSLSVYLSGIKKEIKQC